MKGLTPTGPQQNKWNQLAGFHSKQQKISESKTQSKNVDEYYKIYLGMDQAQSRKNQSSVTQDQQEQNELHDIYNKKLARQYEAVLQEKGIKLFNNDVFNDNNHNLLEQFIQNSDHSLLKALENENAILKQEVANLSTDLNKFISMVELLLDENQYIRNHIHSKNQDISQLIQTIALNDSEALNEQKHKQHILTEENNILIRHLDDMKKEKEQQIDAFKQKDQEVSNAKVLLERANFDLEEALRREELLTRQLSILQPKYQKQSEQILNLEKLEDERRQSLQDQKTEADICKNQASKLKKLLEDLEYKKSLENDQLFQENQHFQTQKKDLQQKVSKIEKTLQSLLDDNQKLQNDCTRYQLDYQKTTLLLDQSNNFLNTEKIRNQQSIERESQQKQVYDKLNSDYETQKLKLQQLEQLYEENQNQLKTYQNESHFKFEKQIEELKKKHRDSMNETRDEIEQLTRSLNGQKRLFDKMNYEIQDLKRENSELNDLLYDSKNKQLIIEEYCAENNRLKLLLQQKLNTQNQDSNQMLEELEFLKRKTNEITRERDTLKEYNALNKQTGQNDYQKLEEKTKSFNETLRQMKNENERLAQQRYEDSVRIEKLERELQNKNQVFQQSQIVQQSQVVQQQQPSQSEQQANNKKVQSVAPQSQVQKVQVVREISPVSKSQYVPVMVQQPHYILQSPNQNYQLQQQQVSLNKLSNQPYLVKKVKNNFEVGYDSDERF